MRKILLSAGMILAVGSLAAKTDPAVYPDKMISDVAGYRLSNNWIISNVEGNFPGIGTDTRTFAYANGKLYFADRGAEAKSSFYIYDAATGEPASPNKVAFPEHVFKKADGSHVSAFPNNCVRTDSKGRLVVMNMTTVLQTSALQVWVFENENDKDPVKVLDYMFSEGTDLSDLRIDFVSVYGDMKGDGYIIAPISLQKDEAVANFVFKWDIVGGTFTPSGNVLDPSSPSNPFLMAIQKYFPVTPHNGAAPYIFPVNEGLFYLDGQTATPGLYDMDGNWQDGFSSETSSLAPAGSANGFAEFEVNGETFFAMGMTDHSSSGSINPHSFGLFKTKDAGFAGLERWFVYPEAGMGNAQNLVRVVLPIVNKINDNKVEIFNYGQKNGVAKYTFLFSENLTGLEESNVLDAVSVKCENGVISVEGADVASLEVFAVTGQKVASANASTVNAPVVNGVYIVKVADQSGATTTQKVLVK